ncbi:hypothetical protein TELCIR_12857 [Teladorsagia circumcincta]|uniref:Calcineurin-like phosphoesterase domain-containing protein n=1 Tax=Teladorsagia circumcincta TaxID=45464 RepID=A0A2G9U720_TELCI|nr:hypothetical protein TELCIR_12857 [Teladorsagia circumcincta]
MNECFFKAELKPRKHKTSMAKSSLEPQPATLEIDAPIVIFGDIHGQLRDLLRFFTIVGPPPQNKILFLGDYVDRCKKSFEIILPNLWCKCGGSRNKKLLRRGLAAAQYLCTFLVTFI